LRVEVSNMKCTGKIPWHLKVPRIISLFPNMPQSEVSTGPNKIYKSNKKNPSNLYKNSFKELVKMEIGV
jgi:hypothetical protein